MNSQLRPSQSSIFHAYNRAKLCHRFESQRLNKALGLVQRCETVVLADGRCDMPSTSPNDFHLVGLVKCDCIDYKRYGPRHYCKHIIAAMILYRAYQYDYVNPSTTVPFTSNSI